MIPFARPLQIVSIIGFITGFITGFIIGSLNFTSLLFLTVLRLLQRRWRECTWDCQRWWPIQLLWIVISTLYGLLDLKTDAPIYQYLYLALDMHQSLYLALDMYQYPSISIGYATIFLKETWAIEGITIFHLKWKGLLQWIAACRVCRLWNFYLFVIFF